MALLLAVSACGDDADSEADVPSDVTFAQLEDAAAETVACINEGGFETKDPVYHPDNFGHVFRVNGTPGLEDEAEIVAEGEEIDRVLVECERKHYFAIEDAWEQTNKDAIDSRQGAIDSDLSDCLSSNGIEVSDQDLSESDREELEKTNPGVYGECMQTALDNNSSVSEADIQDLIEEGG